MIQIREQDVVFCNRCGQAKNVLIRTYSFNYSLCCTGLIRSKRRFSMIHYCIAKYRFVKEMIHKTLLLN